MSGSKRSAANEFSTYYGHPLLIDTGPLRIFLLARIRPQDIGVRGELRGFKKEELLLLEQFLQNFEKIMITPQVLAEISHVIEKEGGRPYFYSNMQSCVTYLADVDEFYFPKREMGLLSALYSLGFTDASILESGKRNNWLVLTKDVALRDACYSCEVPVLHFDLLRTLVWQ